MISGYYYGIIYLGVNCLMTLIWWIIPVYINWCRRKYNLPPKMVIWPIPTDLLEGVGGGVIPMTLAGLLGAAPAIIVYTICYIIYKVFHRCIVGVAFSKEEKVQIAVGSISKEKEG